MAEAPILTTERLILRTPAMVDWPGFAELMASERARYMGGPFALREAWGVFCHGIALWSLCGLGSLSIVHRKTRAWLGQVEINQGPLFPEAELGWQLAQEAEGMGYAQEAAAALRDWAFEAGKMTTFVSYIDPANTRSIRLAERLGATVDAAARPQDEGDLVFRHLP